jgi:cytochrome c biogenesis protein CcmG, thiol:disulfide interchange protein DsbE
MIRMLIPLLIFLGLVGLLLISLPTAEQRRQVASPLIGREVPNITLPSLHEPGVEHSIVDLRGQPFILNVWGSWCLSCRVEHPYITRLGQEAGVPLVGFNWRDERDDALTWLGRFGDAWTFHMVDEAGRAAIDLGVYGAPETFLIDHRGIIRHKHIGPVDQNSFEDLMNRINELRREAGA